MNTGPVAQTIAFLIGNYMTTLFVVGLLVAAVKILRGRRGHSPVAMSGLFLNSFVFWAIGVAQVVNFVMHSVFGDYAAKTIGWAQSPFQLELALSSLGIGVAAFILASPRSTFRGKVALVVATVIFGWGAAAGHVYQILVDHDYAVNNTGLLLFSDIAINAIGLAFVLWHAVTLRRGQAEHTPLARTDALVTSR
ncbi:DUF6790 family protein [Pseudonocardia sp. WMMC193]|uniref:DUF6790 family protein n=1 Tax=Pseudonocardia sp. WMMC193 TaxID=2911965 RepID=UPI001F45BD4B|nr:DUF6790 family protein [Pseudonocardia sp. WMMC193]MCF7553652.1 hypothetical protein [Pseudonocardia sp. WMMC193]